MFITYPEGLVSFHGGYCKLKTEWQAGSFCGQKSLTSYLQTDVRQSIKGKRRQRDLLGRILDEANTSLDVGLQALDCFIQELLLVVIGAAEDVDSFFSSVGLIES